MSPVDIIFAVLLVLAMLRGYSKGLLRTAATYVAPVLGFMIAKDFSDPVRDRLAMYDVVPDFALDFFAPLLVFIVVVIIVRLFAGLVARLLGVGLSVPSRILAGLASVGIIAIVLGGVVILIRELRPREHVSIGNSGAPAGDPLENLLVTLDQRFSESLLAPTLEQLAGTVVAKTISHTPTPLPVRQDIREQIENAAQKAAEAAVGSMGKPPRAAPPAASTPAPARNDDKKPADRTNDAPKPAPRSNNKDAKQKI